MSNQGIIMKQLEQELKQIRGEIIGLARWLAEDLNQLAWQLEEPEDRQPNSLGILQGNGVKLDWLCGRYEMAKRHLEMLKAAEETQHD